MKITETCDLRYIAVNGDGRRGCSHRFANEPFVLRQSCPALAGNTHEDASPFGVFSTGKYTQPLPNGRLSRKWVLLWLWPRQKREFGRRTAAAARRRDPDGYGNRPLRRRCDASIPPSHHRHNRRDVPISPPTSPSFETEPTDPNARRLSVPLNGREAAAARALEERQTFHVGCRVDRHGVVVVLQLPEVPRFRVRVPRARPREWRCFPL